VGEYDPSVPCEKHELSFCSLCKPTHKPRTLTGTGFRNTSSLPRQSTPGVKIAEYDGRCAECPVPIYAGDEIATNDDGQWCHVDCS
jgi:hypothetical protein